MGDLSEFSLPVRLFLKAYPWRRIDPVPWTPLRRPLAECKLALVTSAGLVPPGGAPFDRSIRGGDVSFREIPSDVDPATLSEQHRSSAFDRAGITADRELALPLARAAELVRRGRIGSLNHRHLSLQGSITAPGRLVKRTAPEACARLVDDGVDVCLLVPV